MNHKITKYFALPELVSRKVYAKYGDFAWNFFDPRLLDVLVWLREGLGVPLVCNTKDLQQRGLRENTCAIVQERTRAGALYLSAHVLGKGVDLSSGQKSAVEIRKWIRMNIDSCPWPIRLENDKSAPTWVHLDTMNELPSKLIEFNA